MINRNMLSRCLNNPDNTGIKNFNHLHEHIHVKRQKGVKITESSHRDLLTKYLFERGYLPEKCLCV